MTTEAAVSPFHRPLVFLKNHNTARKYQSPGMEGKNIPHHKSTSQAGARDGGHDQQEERLTAPVLFPAIRLFRFLLHHYQIKCLTTRQQEKMYASIFRKPLVYHAKEPFPVKGTAPEIHAAAELMRRAGSGRRRRR